MTNPIQTSDNWELIPLGKIVKSKKGKLPTNFISEKSSEVLPYVDIQAFEKGVLRRFAKMDDGVLCEKNDVLMVWDGARSGLVGTGIRGLVGSTLTVFECPKSIFPKYLYYFLRSKYNYINTNPKGDRIPHVDPAILWDVPIPVPKIGIQKKVVKKIEQTLKELEVKTKQIFFPETNELNEILENSILYLFEMAFQGNLTSKWRQVNLTKSSLTLLNNIQEKRKSKFNNIYKNKKKKYNKEFCIIGPNKNVSTWTDVKLENLISIEGRICWKGLQRDEYIDRGPLFLSVHSLNYGDIVDFRDAFHIPKWRYDESPGLKLEENDILLAKDGAGIGKIGIICGLNEPTTVNSSILVIRSKEAFIPKFLFYFLKGPEIQKIVKSRISGDRIPHLFQRDIKNFILSVPPLEEQKEIVKIIEAKLERLEELESHILKLSMIYDEQKTNVCNLSNSILSSAFLGKLQI